MLRLRLLAPLLAAALIVPQAASAQPLSANEALVLKAMDEVFNKRDVSAIGRYWGTPYIQHNPTVPNGHEGLIGLVKNLGPNFRFEPGMITSRGDIVMIHGRYSGWGPKPMIIVDIFRIKDGRFVEHWDVIQEEVPTSQTKSGNPMFTPGTPGQ